MNKYLKRVLSVIVLTIFIFSGVTNVNAQVTTEKSKVLYELKDWTKLSEHVYVSTGDYLKVNMVLVVYNDKGTLIDLGYKEPEGKRVKEFMEKNNIKLENIIVTHLHGDHIGNQTMFEVPDDRLFPPYSITDGQIIEMENEKFKIIKTPGHADNIHVSVELVNENILVAGDVVVTNLLPLLAYGGSYNELKGSLEKIKKNEYDIIIPGHGDIIDSTLAIDNNIEYLINVYNKVDKISASTNRPTSIEELKGKLYESIKIEDCIKDTSLFSENQEANHNGNIDKILNSIMEESFLKGEIKTPNNILNK